MLPSYWQLLLLILPVFAVIAVGVGVRRAGWVEGVAEQSLIRLTVNVCYPAFIFESVVGNPTMRTAGNLLVPPLIGFGTTALGIALGFQVARAIGLTVGTGLRTFALAVGVCNYGYLPLPVMEAMFGPESRGVLLVNNVGVEAAIWSVGVLVMSGLSLREGWRKLASPVLFALAAGVVCNLTGLGARLPECVRATVHPLAVCGIPLGLVMTGVNLAKFLGEPRELFQPRITLAAAALRCGVLPLVFLALARWLPVSVEMKRVIVVQGAMPAAVIPVIIASLYGGQPRVAVQVVLATTALGVFVIPLWLRLGLAWAL